MQDLLKQLVLSETRLLKLSAELLRPAEPAKELRAKVEFSLTPLPVPDQPAERPLLRANAQVVCEGFVGTEADGEPLFRVICLQQLSYRQVVGTVLDHETFNANHMSLNRQVYPLLIQQVQPLLAQLGQSKVKLPMDMMQLKAATADRPDQVH